MSCIGLLIVYFCKTCLFTSRGNWVAVDVVVVVAVVVVVVVVVGERIAVGKKRREMNLRQSPCVGKASSFFE